MHSFTAVLTSIAVALLADCGGSNRPAAQSTAKQHEPCGRSGISYSPVGQIARMDQIALKDRRDYGTHVLLDSSDHVQWVLQSPEVNLDNYAADGRWYRVEGERSTEHDNLFIVCLVYFE